ncbi:uncharacterized protein BO66DRAFT_186314 [Aspergillus aculeatinus CBS 121060]|uniref:Uncharacterized protein n=1 Tax=Aspergillus aculeatinus CBS 121060 TaxID=1448322 RepID=A0ACD1GY36_9EURO|nr:hypothetical protein BO66DRAFT_186314 [Aspergillus aculeatinus CBS 121060]RAH66237.1 hypothetical protein BO66DRAFT_186314 [Aspergillus aculeatinus CBS 121060]
MRLRSKYWMHKKHCALVLLDLGFGIFIQGKGICGRSTRDEQQQQSGNYSSGIMIPSRCTCRIGAGLSVWKGSPPSGSIYSCLSLWRGFMFRIASEKEGRESGCFNCLIPSLKVLMVV